MRKLALICLLFCSCGTYTYSATSAVAEKICTAACTWNQNCGYQPQKYFQDCIYGCMSVTCGQCDEAYTGSGLQLNRCVYQLIHAPCGQPNWPKVCEGLLPPHI